MLRAKTVAMCWIVGGVGWSTAGSCLKLNVKRRAFYTRLGDCHSTVTGPACNWSTSGPLVDPHGPPRGCCCFRLVDLFFSRTRRCRFVANNLPFLVCGSSRSYGTPDISPIHGFHVNIMLVFHSFPHRRASISILYFNELGHHLVWGGQWIRRSLDDWSTTHVISANKKRKQRYYSNVQVSIWKIACCCCCLPMACKTRN